MIRREKRGYIKTKDNNNAALLLGLIFQIIKETRSAFGCSTLLFHLVCSPGVTAYLFNTHLLYQGGELGDWNKDQILEQGPDTGTTTGHEHSYLLCAVVVECRSLLFVFCGFYKHAFAY